jgi:hypothetical protein
LRKDFTRIQNDVFIPYEPSANIRREFRQIEERIGAPDPYVEAIDVINEIKLDLRSLSLDDDFDDFINIERYLPGLPAEIGPLSQAPLPQQPMPSPSVVGQVQPQQMTTSQGLTPTELALLSPEEQQIRLRQRGLA